MVLNTCWEMGYLFPAGELGVPALPFLETCLSIFRD